MLAVLHRLFQCLLVIGEQSMNLVVRFLANGMNLWTKLLSGGFRILIEQRLNLIVVLLKQNSDLMLLWRSQLQILCQSSQLLVDRLRPMYMLKAVRNRLRAIEKNLSSMPVRGFNHFTHWRNNAKRII